MAEMMNQDPKRNPPYIEEDEPAEAEETAEAAEPVKEEKKSFTEKMKDGFKDLFD